MKSLKTPILLAVFLMAFPISANANQSSEVVERFHGSLLAVMKEAGSLGLKGRFERLEPEIEQAFDLSRMIRVAAGKFWRKADPGQQEKLLSAFKRLSVTTYASKFDGFSGEAFKTVGERPGPQKTLLVETKILRPKKSPVGLTYVMKNKKKDGEDWRIVDVLLDNSISELAVRRSEYNLVLKKNGIEGLVATLHKKAAELVAK